MLGGTDLQASALSSVTSVEWAQVTMLVVVVTAVYQERKHVLLINHSSVGVVFAMHASSACALSAHVLWSLVLFVYHRIRRDVTVCTRSIACAMSINGMIRLPCCLCGGSDKVSVK